MSSDSSPLSSPKSKFILKKSTNVEIIKNLFLENDILLEHSNIFLNCLFLANKNDFDDIILILKNNIHNYFFTKKLSLFFHLIL